MAKATTLAQRFHALFTGLDRAHGHFQPNGHRPDGKVEGKSAWVKTGPATVERWAQHLAGSYSLGVAPLRDDGTVCWGNIDVDDYPADYAALEQRITAQQLPLLITESKSGGAELLLFCKEPVPASIVRRALIRWRRSLGLPDETEIFPKQDHLRSKKDFGNWLNMPYFGGTRFARHGGERVASPAAFLQLARRKAVARADLESLLAEPEPSDSAAPSSGALKTTVTRNVTLFQLASALRRKGVSEEAALAACREENAAFEKGPQPEWEVEKAVKSAYGRYAETETDALAEMNAHYAVVTTGGRVGVLRMDLFDRDGALEVLGRSDFRFKLANRRFPDYEDKRGKLHRGSLVAEWWIEHPQRREFAEIVFDPSGAARPEALNLWRGFALSPDPEPRPERRCARFLTHVHNHVCGGDEALYRKVVGWFAQMFQQPTRKLDTALVLRGPQGSGKSIVGKTIGHLLGRHYRPIAKARLITGQFNSHLAHVLLLQAEEAFWAGDKQAEGVLKDLITNDKHLIEFKGKEPFEVDNYLRLLVTSNAPWVVPAGVEERRFMVLDMTNKDHRADANYFGAMQEELNAGGYSALLAYLLAFDWRSGRPDLLPATAALTEQKEDSLAPPVKYLYGLADQAWLPKDAAGSGIVKYEHLWEDFTRWARGLSLRHFGSQPQFTRDLNRFLTQYQCMPLTRRRPRDTGGEQRLWYEFPALGELRATFARALGTMPEWAQPENANNSGWWESQPERDEL